MTVLMVSWGLTRFCWAMIGEALRARGAIRSADLSWFILSPMGWVDSDYGFVWRLAITSLFSLTQELLAPSALIARSLDSLAAASAPSLSPCFASILAFRLSNS